MDTFMDWFWLMIWWFFFLMYLMILFRIVADLFRDHELSGWWKALWIVALVVVPFLSALIYVIARGRGMAERQMQDMSQAKAQTDEYIRDVAGDGSSAAAQIGQAKALLDSGVIDANEFATLKAKALA